MTTIAERVSIAETQVANLDEKLADLKQDISLLQRCINDNRDDLINAIAELKQESSDQHAVLAGKISHLERLREKYTYLIIGGVATAGFFVGHFTTIQRVLG